MNNKIDAMRALENDPAFKGAEFSDHSSKEDWLDAIDFAARWGGILQSAREAAAFYFYAKGEHDTNDNQVTRTVALGFKAGNKFYIAIDDTVNPEQNIVIAKTKERYNSYNSLFNRNYLLSVTDPLVKSALSRAEKTGRIVEANSVSMLDLKTDAVNGKSEFGQHDLSKAILLDFAEHYAQMIRQAEQCDVGAIWSLTPEDLEKNGADSKHVDVQPVCLGYITVNAVSNSTFDLLDTVGRACAVRGARDFSADKKIVNLRVKGLYARVRKMAEE